MQTRPRPRGAANRAHATPPADAPYGETLRNPIPKPRRLLLPCVRMLPRLPGLLTPAARSCPSGTFHHLPPGPSCWLHMFDMYLRIHRQRNVICGYVFADRKITFLVTEIRVSLLKMQR